jgi:hypothetical protein
MAGAGGPRSPSDRLPPTARGPQPRGRIGMLLTLVGARVHSGSVVTRGLAADRVPWGNMYEFSSCVALTGVVTFLVLVAAARSTAAWAPS